MENIEDVSAFVRSLDASIDNLADALDPVLSQGLEDAIANCSSPQEKIKVYHSHLYTVISVLFTYIKVLGIKTETHPIMKELTRIKGSMKAMKDFEASASKKSEDAEKSALSANQFLQRTLGTTGGQAAPENLKSPAISSANFKGTHTKFTDDEDKTTLETPVKQSKPAKQAKQAKNTKRDVPNKVTKPKKRKN